MRFQSIVSFFRPLAGTLISRSFEDAGVCSIVSSLLIFLSHCSAGVPRAFQGQQEAGATKTRPLQISFGVFHGLRSRLDSIIRPVELIKMLSRKPLALRLLNQEIEIQDRIYENRDA